MQNPLPKSDLEFIYQKSIKSFDKIKNQSLLITGATGFFGSWFTQAIQYANQNYNANIELTLVSRKQQDSLVDNAFVKYVTCDLQTESLPTNIYADYFLHMAAQVHKTALTSPADPTQPLLIENILPWLLKNKLKKMVYTSSGAVYGHQTKDFVSENDKISPTISPYGNIKQLEEQWISQQSGLNWSIARCFAFAGPLIPLNKDYAVGNFIKNVLNNEDIHIKSDGTAVRSYMYPADLVIWLFTFLTEAQPSTVFNVGSNQAISIYELAKKISTFSKSSQVKVLEKQTDLSKQTRYVPDVNRAMNEFGLKLHFAIDDSIEKTIRWLNS